MALDAQERTVHPQLYSLENRTATALENNTSGVS
jgi:hypothetical protein